MPCGPAFDQGTAEGMDGQIQLYISSLPKNGSHMASKMFLLFFASYDGPVKRKGHCGRKEVGRMSLLVTDRSQSKVTCQSQATAGFLYLLAYSFPKASDQTLLSSGQTLRKTYEQRSDSAWGRVTMTVPSIFFVDGSLG